MQDRDVSETHPLDNPVWSALSTTHAEIARHHGSAAAYLDEISPFMGCATLDAAGWRDLAALDNSARLIRKEIGELPEGATAPFRAGLRQMVAPRLADYSPRFESRPLTVDDVPSMLDLTGRTKPGPFKARTIEFGGYYGIFVDDALMAMAGRRMQTPGYCEISAVCTDPAFAGRGAASDLTRLIASQIQAEGNTAFLHVSDENPTAGRLYEHLGFTVRAHLQVAMVVFPSPESSK